MRALASYLSMLIVKAKLCHDMHADDRAYYNIIIVAAHFAQAVYANFLTCWIVNKLTKESTLRLKSSIMAVKLALIFVIFSQEMRQDTFLASLRGLLFACPFDVADFALALVVYMTSVDLLLLFVALSSWMTRSNDQMAITVTFLVLIGMWATVYRE